MTAKIPLHLAAERYLSGESSTSIAAAFGVTPPTLRRRLVAAGVAIRTKGNRPKLSPEQIQQAKQLDVHGAKRSYIGALFGICQTTLRRYLGNRRPARPSVAILGGIAVKRCSSCWVTRPLSEFHDDCTKRDGMRSNCRRCAATATPPAASC